MDECQKPKVQSNSPRPAASDSGSKIKPDIPDNVLENWQKTVDLMAEIVGVPAGLIMELSPPELEVAVTSSTEGNPFKKGKKARLKTGLYCETVMTQNAELLIPNASKDPVWEHSPGAKRGMISYLGYPLQWSDGEMFGTICVMDKKENAYSKTYRELVKQFRNIINGDLKLLEAHAQVRVLSGLLPICAACKKIRDDNGYWKQIEIYIQERSEADFSHSICPGCIRKLYPDISIPEYSE